MLAGAHAELRHSRRPRPGGVAALRHGRPEARRDAARRAEPEPIARSTGEELWRTEWRWLGKELYRRLARVAAAEYGDRLVGLEVDVPPDEYLAFHND